MAANDPFDLKFTSREVTAWGGLALHKRPEREAWTVLFVAIFTTQRCEI
jgi:hypothetical protein